MSESKEIEKMKKAFPEITSKLEKENVKEAIKFAVFLYAIMVISLDIVSFLPTKYLFTASIIFSILGAFYVSISSIKSVPEVLFMYASQMGYNNPPVLAPLKKSFLTARGLILILFSIIMQVLQKSFPIV